MMTREKLKGLLRYEPEAGVFRWKINGDVAGKIDGLGYIVITACGKKYLAHRLAWFFIHGYFSEYQIGHVNGKRDDNRIKNLRRVYYNDTTPLIDIGRDMTMTVA